MTNSEIRFDVQPHADLQWHTDREVLEVLPHINDTPLTALIDRFEADAEMSPSGGYGGLIPSHYRFGPLEDHFHGRSTTTMGPGTPVLGCACGDWGCRPLMARISATGGLVVWDSFERPNKRKTRDYSSFGPFLFHRQQYDDALHTLTATIDSDTP